jgi:HEAT repeat protein
MSPGAPPKRSPLLLAVLGALFILVPFLFWHQTWFGRRLTDQEIGQYLQDTEHPRKIQQALSQIADRIMRGDATVQTWYPKIPPLAQHPNAIIRTTAAWVMGQDNTSEAFHRALLDLLKDSEVMVRRNAALALVRFQDSSGRAELVKMLQPFAITAPVEGTVTLQTQPGLSLGAGILLVRIRPAQGQEVEVRSPFAGMVERIFPQDKSHVGAGDPVVLLAPGADQVAEALRGLYLVGQPEDLPDVERYKNAVPLMPDNIRQQAVLTAQAIRTRAEQNPSR